MAFIAKFLLLAGLVRFLIAMDKPFLCSGIYAVAVFALRLAFHPGFLSAVVIALIAFGLASAYFWLLSHLDLGSFVWWLVGLAGLSLTLL